MGSFHGVGRVQVIFVYEVRSANYQLPAPVVGLGQALEA